MLAVFIILVVVIIVIVVGDFPWEIMVGSFAAWGAVGVI